MSAVGAQRANIPQTGKIYLRVKYQGWPVDKAIAEMRQYGHVWKNFAAAGGPTVLTRETFARDQ